MYVLHTYYNAGMTINKGMNYETSTGKKQKRPNPRGSFIKHVYLSEVQKDLMEFVAEEEHRSYSNMAATAIEFYCKHHYPELWNVHYEQLKERFYKRFPADYDFRGSV